MRQSDGYDIFMMADYRTGLRVPVKKEHNIRNQKARFFAAKPLIGRQISIDRPQ